MSGKDFINVLKSLDIDSGAVRSESVDWLFCKKETNDILLWMCKYINENNIETDQELYLTESIKENSEIISGQKYNEKLNEINDTYPGILDINLEDITRLEKELAVKEKTQETLEKLTTNYLTLDYKIQQHSVKLERTELQLQAENETIKNRCLLRSKEIDAEHDEIQKNVMIYSSILHNHNTLGTGEKYFISQMHFNILRQQDDIFNTSLKLWIDKEFGINASKSLCDNSVDVSSIGKEYDRIYECLCTSIIDKISAECTSIETASRIEYLDNNLNDFEQLCYEQEQKINEIQIRSNIRMLIEEFHILRDSELSQAVEKYVQNMINSSLASQAKVKYNKCCKMLSNMIKLNTFLLEAFSKKYLLVLLMNSEKHKLQSTIKNLSKTQIYLNKLQQEVNDKIYSMELFEQDFLNYEQTPLVEREQVISDFLKAVSGDFKTVDIKDALTIVQEQNALIERLKQDAYKQQNQEHSELFIKYENKINEFKEKLWSGPTMQPCIIPYAFIENMYELESHLQKSKDGLNNVCHTYKKTQQHFNDRWVKDKKLLPVWFLTEPKKLTSAIKRIEEHIVGKPVMPEVPEAVLIDI